ncbi:MAG: hypothetical protein LC768_14405 [Acidobacteria bacterium]|nr:hypothetical protein [Acidobacteriota bacterium]MCA1639502.1 hypothetical protein [Acidobacteriota bacterium]
MTNLTKKEIVASVQNISKSFGATPVLEDISFDVNEGESLVLLGASGRKDNDFTHCRRTRNAEFWQKFSARQRRYRASCQ